MNKEKKTNCPNCGAPISHYYNYKCEYCGTFLHNTDEKIKQFNNVDINIKDIEIERGPYADSIVITLRGYSIPRLQWYEEGKNVITVSGEDLGKRIGYRIEIPYRELVQNLYINENISYMLQRLDASLPPIFEKERVIYQIIEKLIDWRNHRG